MRPITHFTLHAALVAALVSFAATSAAAADYFLKLGDVKGESSAKAGGGKQIVIESWSWGATRKGWDGTIKGSPSAEKYGAVSGVRRDDGVDAPSAAAPLDRGSVRVKVKFPWLDCKVGAAFADAVLQNDAGRFEFKDAIITGCASDAITLDYAKVKVRAWDPSKKEH